MGLRQLAALAGLAAHRLRRTHLAGLLGHPPRALLFRLYASFGAWLEAIPPEDRSRVLAASSTKQVSGEYDEVYRIVRPDGSARWIHDRGFPVRDTEGKVYRIAGVAEDITDRKRAEDERDELLLRLQLQIERLPLAYLLTGIDLRYADWNPEAERIFGFSATRAEDAKDPRKE